MCSDRILTSATPKSSITPQHRCTSTSLVMSACERIFSFLMRNVAILILIGLKAENVEKVSQAVDKTNLKVDICSFNELNHR